MPNFHSLHFGLNRVDPVHYQNLPPLRAAVNDAQDWVKMAKIMFGYQTQELFTDEQATAHKLFERLGFLANSLQSGDALLLTYAGHGGQLDDPLSPKIGDEDKDETWCMYDRQVVDDELHYAFSKFRSGVRISVIADCCHSGTVLKDIRGGITETEIAALEKQNQTEDAMQSAGFQPRRLTNRESTSIFIKNNALYTEILKNIPNEKIAVAASVQLFAACQDDQVTFDGDTNGIFTDAFKTLVYSGEWQQLNNRDLLLERLRSFFRYPKPNHQAYGPDLHVFDQKFPLLADLPAVAPANVPSAPERHAHTIPASEPSPTEPSKPAFYKVKIEFPAENLSLETIQSICPNPIIDLQFSNNAKTAMLWFPSGSFPSVWEPIHHIAQKADDLGLQLYVEPVATLAVPLEPEPAPARDVGEAFSYLPYWPPGMDNPIPTLDWHLDAAHSQLAAARDFVWGKMRNNEIAENIRIGQLDTGWFPWHPGFVNNPNILRNLSRSFVDKEKGINAAAVDIRYKKGEQQGHGSGTLGVLACWQLEAEHTDGVQLGHLGAVPFTEVIPIRIADNVLIFDSENFCEGLEYAIANGCEVVTLSMGGKPSRGMAKLINRAYEQGITIICAAGNNIAKGLASVGPRTIVWPARFERVIAACGACHNHFPYDFEAQKKYGTAGTRTNDYRNMQGNWGPAKAMHKALAAYSPNIAWVVDDDNNLLRKTGGGTSATTPQIAAAAALWLTLHKATLKNRGYHGTWKQVEAVREALFRTADKSFPESEKYYGNGILRALDALHYGVPDIPDNLKSEAAKSSLFGLGETLRLFLHRRRAGDMPGPVLQQTLELELQYLLLEDAELAGRDAYSPAADTEPVQQVVQRAEYCSAALRAGVGL